MGAQCAKITIQAIPDKAVMLEVVDRIVEFEDMLKRGESLTRAQEKEKRLLEPVAKEMKKIQGKERTVVKRAAVTHEDVF